MSNLKKIPVVSKEYLLPFIVITSLFSLWGFANDITNPMVAAFGTVMEIPGYGYGVVEDRGGAIKGQKVDIFFPKHKEAINWGRKKLKVKVWKTK